MKRLIGILIAAMVAAALTGCASNSSHKEVHLNMENNQPAVGANNGAGTTTTALVTTEQTVDKNREPTIAKKYVNVDLYTNAKFHNHGSMVEGILHLTGNSFIFSPTSGEEVYFPLNSVLLIVVDYRMDADHETLVLFTNRDEFEFKVEIGYTNKISDYVFVSESAA